MKVLKRMAKRSRPARSGRTLGTVIPNLQSLSVDNRRTMCRHGALFHPRLFLG